MVSLLLQTVNHTTGTAYVKHAEQLARISICSSKILDSRLNDSCNSENGIRIEATQTVDSTWIIS